MWASILSLQKSKIRYISAIFWKLKKIANSGIGVGMKSWMRVTFAIEPSYIDEAFGRIKAFYLRHAKKSHSNGSSFIQ